MAFLRETTAGYLRDHLARTLVRPVTVRLFLRPEGGRRVPGEPYHETCAGAQALAEELAGLNDKLHLEIIDISAQPQAGAAALGVGVPLIAVQADTEPPAAGAGPASERWGSTKPDSTVWRGARVGFLGLPSGYESAALIQTIAAAGGPPGWGLAPESLARLARLSSSIEIKTFVTPT